LQTCYEHNSLALVDLDTAVDSAVLGDGAFRVTWDAELGAPTVSPVDPATLVCVREPDDYRRLVRVEQTYPASAEFGMRSSEFNTAVPNSALRTPHSEVTEVWTADTLEIWRGGELQESLPNPYGFIPYVIFPNLRVPKEPWG